MHNKSLLISKLSALKDFLFMKNLFHDSYALGKIIFASEQSGGDKMAPTSGSFLDETVPMGPRPSWTSRSEPFLFAAGLKPIKFIAGTEAEKRGEGRSSAEGNIYEILYEGSPAVAKVLMGSEGQAEPLMWRKIMEVKDQLPEEQAKHLPLIHDIIDVSPASSGYPVSIVVMEKLSEPNWHIKDVLRSKKNRGKEVLMEDSDFLSEALKKAFDRIDEHKPDDLDSKDREVYAMFDTERETLRMLVEGALLKRQLSPDQVSERIQEFFKSYLDRFNLADSSLTATIADDIQDYFVRHFEPSERPIPKYFSPKGIDHTLEMLEQGEYAQPISEENEDRISILKKEREKAVYNENPTSFLYAEKHMPETKSFFSMLNSLQKLGIEWSDVHANNIMERPGSRELVLIDVGMFH